MSAATAIKTIEAMGYMFVGYTIRGLWVVNVVITMMKVVDSENTINEYKYKLKEVEAERDQLKLNNK